MAQLVDGRTWPRPPEGPCLARTITPKAWTFFKIQTPQKMYLDAHDKNLVHFMGLTGMSLPAISNPEMEHGTGSVVTLD